jgi:hypothetical protein
MTHSAVPGQARLGSTIMAWDRGYYYRVRKVNGRVVREYIGKGRVAELMAQQDGAEREGRRLDAEVVRCEKAELDDLDATLEAISRTTDLAARAAILAAGFHQHRRGEWRKRHVKTDSAA